jgi:hypothetical protein
VGKIDSIPLPLPEDLHMDNDEEKGIQDFYYLLSVAYGLSIHPAQYPKIYLPSEVSPLGPLTPVKEEDDSAPWGPVYPDTK